MEVTERNSAKLCHIFGRGPDTKMVVKNLGSFLYNVGLRNYLFSGSFTTTSRLKCEYLRNETRYTQWKTLSK